LFCLERIENEIYITTKDRNKEKLKTLFFSYFQNNSYDDDKSSFLFSFTQSLCFSLKRLFDKTYI